MTRDHLDDEALSAAIDGEAPAGALDHLASCRDCGARIASLRSAASAVSAAAVRRSVEEAEHAVAAAIDAAGVTAGRTGSARRAGVIATLRQRPAALAMAVAAVLILAVGVTGALRLSGTSGKSDQVGLSTKATGSAAGAPEAAQGATSGTPGRDAAPAVVTEPDLGAQSDATAVAGLVRSRLGQAAAAPAFGAAGSSQATGSQAVIPAQTLACAPEAARAAGVAPASSLRLIGNLQWRGQAAAVFVFDQPSTGSGLAGVIVRPSDCAALATLPF